MSTILHYLILIFATAIFAFIYFKFLKYSLDKVLSKEKNFNFIYYSFIIRICLTILFFYVLLKYYNDIQEIFIVIVIFLCCRFLILRKEKNIQKEKTK